MSAAFKDRNNFPTETLESSIVCFCTKNLFAYIDRKHACLLKSHIDLQKLPSVQIYVKRRKLHSCKSKIWLDRS